MKLVDKCKSGFSKLGAAVSGLVVTVGSSISALAAEGDSSLTNDVMSSVQGGMSQATSGVGSVLKVAIPVIIGIVVAVIIAKAGISWLKSIGSKAK